MRGDVNGDGVITNDDMELILKSVGGTATLSDIQQWCADVNSDNAIDGMDAVAIQRYVSGIDDITKEDYYNNWTWKSNVKAWITDLEIPDIDTTYDVVFTIGNKENKETFIRVERSKNINLIRVYAKTPPIEDIDAAIICKKGTGKFITTFESPISHASIHASNGSDPITPKSIGAAPDGYGLGGVGKLLTSADNIDTLKTNGWYYWRTSSLPQGTLPTSVMQYCTQIRVTNDGATTCVQEAFGITDGNTTRNCLVRRILYGSSRIYNWQWVNPPFVQGMVYETVEKYDGKVVYKKKLADGIYWSIDDGVTWKPEATYIGALPISGGTMTGSLTLKDDPTKDLEAATKQYVDNHTVSAMVYEDGLPEKPSAPIADGQEIPYTWEQINAITLAGKAQEYFSLGATKLVNLSTAVLGANAATMMVIGFNQDGENTTTFQTKGVLPTTTAFSSSAIWIDSTVRTQCQVFYNACEAKSFIKTVSKGTCPKQVADKNGTATYNNETVWIPSETEMGLDNHSSLTKSNSTTSNSECTKGYNAGYSYYTSYTTRVKYQMNANGSLTTTAASYWERSRYYGRTNNVCGVNVDGKPYGDHYNNSNGFAPAFVIGNSTLSAKITQDGEDITDKVKELITSDSQNPVFLKRITTSADAASISIDVSDINFDDYYEVVMYTNLVDPTNQYAGSTPMCKIRINNVSRSEYGFSNGTNANGEIGQFQYIYSGALLNTKRFTSSPCKVYIQKKDSAIFVYGSYTYIIWSGDRTWNHATEIYGEFELGTSEAFSSLQIIAEDGKSTIRTGSTIEFWGYKK